AALPSGPWSAVGAERTIARDRPVLQRRWLPLPFPCYLRGDSYRSSVGQGRPAGQARLVQAARTGFNSLVVSTNHVLPALRAAVRNENVRRVELAWGAAIAAEWSHFVALGVFAYQRGGASAVGIAGLVRLLPAGAV